MKERNILTKLKFLKIAIKIWT